MHIETERLLLIPCSYGRTCSVRKKSRRVQ